MSTIARRLVTALASIGVVLAAAGPALAHAELVSSTPADGSVLGTPPAVVELRFSEGIDAARSSFRLIGPDGELGTGTLNRDGGRVMRLDGLALSPGAYEIRWTIGSADGHVERGRIRFTVSEPSAAPATASPAATGAASGGPPASPSTAPGTAAPASAVPPSAAPGGSPVPDPGRPAAGTGADVLVPIVAALVLVGGIGAMVLRRGRGA